MLKSIFYARFHPERGPDVLHQVPEGSVSRASSSSSESAAVAVNTSTISSATHIPSLTTTTTPALVPFSSLSAYLIPPHELSNRPLAICAEGQRVLGFPISIEGEGYERNRFVCNVCFVVDEQEEDVEGWQRIVRKTAAFMRALEAEGTGGVLRGEERVVDEAVERGEDPPQDGEGDFLVVRWILKEIFEQMNAYGECCVRVSSTQVLNLRLERRMEREMARPTKVKAWDVPLIVRELPDPASWTWDLVLEQIHPYIDGINHVKRIARLADVDLRLVKKAIRELVAHQRAIVLDIFHFQAIYALTGDFTLFVNDLKSVDECRSYVAIDPKESIFASILAKDVLSSTPPIPDRTTLIDLYSVLKPGLSVADFCLAHQDLLANIDIRRFITFGVIKGFLRRMHKFALALDPPELPSTPAVAQQQAGTDLDKAWRKAALSSGWATPPAADGVGELQARLETEEGKEREERAILGRCLDGKTCLDNICLEMGMEENKVMEKIRSGVFGEVIVFCK